MIIALDKHGVYGTLPNRNTGRQDHCNRFRGLVPRRVSVRCPVYSITCVLPDRRRSTEIMERLSRVSGGSFQRGSKGMLMVTDEDYAVAGKVD